MRTGVDTYAPRMGAALVADTCNATRRERGRLLICSEPMNHASDHRDGEYSWPTKSDGNDTTREIQLRYW